MDYINIKANAKINIALDVLGKRIDGYHDLKMIMQTVGLHDSLFMKKIFTPQIKIITNLRWLPTDERNLVYKAAQKLFDRYPPKEGVFIEINKSIPVCAGLGGGSADCAAALVGLRRLFDLPASNEELQEIGATLGADVPYCLMRGTALAEGTGEKLTKLSPHPPVNVLISKPNISLSTGDIFRNFNMANVTKRPDIPALIAAIENGDCQEISKGFCNVLESVSIKRHPIINEIKETMLALGADGALMSGSGPSVFGYFADRDTAYNAMKHLRFKSGIRETYLTTIFNPGRNEYNEQ